jgi:NAD(P)H dehydrogenase (quinone)
VPERSILVFGATGALGGHLLPALTARDVPSASITAAGRNAGRLGEFAAAGFRSAEVDLSDAERVADLVGQHTDVVLISGGDPDRLAQHRSVIDAARAAGIRHLFYTSGVRADDDRFPINADHRATEQALGASGVPYTILRNTWYIENYAQALAGPRHTGILAAAVGDAVVAAASRADLAEALAVVVTSDGHDGATYSLSGDTDFTYDDIAAAMAVVLDHDVTYQPTSPEALRAMLQGAGMDEGLAGFLVGLDETIGAGVYARVGDDLQRLLGRPTTGLVDGLRAA